MSEAIVGINQSGEVRAMFCIDSKADEREASRLAGCWLREGRTVKRCSEAHASEVMGHQWHEPNAPRDLRGDSRVTVHADVRQDGGEA